MYELDLYFIEKLASKVVAQVTASSDTCSRLIVQRVFVAIATLRLVPLSFLSTTLWCYCG